MEELKGVKPGGADGVEETEGVVARGGTARREGGSEGRWEVRGAAERASEAREGGIEGCVGGGREAGVAAKR